MRLQSRWKALLRCPRLYSSAGRQSTTKNCVDTSSLASTSSALTGRHSRDRIWGRRV